jgi:hypothetical protein
MRSTLIEDFRAGAYIAEVRPSDGTVLLAKRLGGVQGIAFDGANVWVADWEFDLAHKL